MEYKYEIVKYSYNYPAKIYLQNKPGRRCNTSIHWHKAMELLYIIDGSLNVMENGKATELKSGDVYFVNHDCFHKTFTSYPNDTVKYLVVLLSYESLLAYYPNYSRFEFVLRKSEPSEEKITDLLKQTALFFEEKPPGYEMMINSLLHGIYYVLISECICENSGKASYESSKETEYVKTAIEYMGKHHLENLTLKKISAEIGLSSSYFSRCFKSVTGTSVMQYLSNIRLESALRDIIFENKSVTDAAFDNGFTSVKSFIELCKKTYNRTPGQYKEQLKS